MKVNIDMINCAIYFVMPVLSILAIVGYKKLLNKIVLINL